MLNEPMDVQNDHPIRNTDEQKAAFRADVQAYLKELGYESHMEACGSNGQNIVFGAQETAHYLVTAHYDTPVTIGIPNVCTPCNLVLFVIWNLVLATLFVCPGAGGFLLIREGYILPGLVLIVCLGVLLLRLYNAPANVNNANDNTSGVVTLLEIARTLPPAHRSKVCFVLFDLEEDFRKGSKAYRKAHKATTEKQIVLNLDCVGDGDHILFMPRMKTRKNQHLINRLKYLGGWFGPKQILVVDKGFCFYNSDHRKFPQAVGIAAFHKKKGKGYVLDKIHTKHDSNLEITNVNLLRAALTTIICGEAVK